MIKYLGSAIVLTVLGFAMAYQFVDPAPPTRISIATGARDGAYFGFANAYRRELAKEGIELEVIETAGSVENLARLRDESSGTDIAFVQGGVAGPAGTKGAGAKANDGLLALGSVYFEPLWVFHRPETPIGSLADLHRKRVAIGPLGSGTRNIALALLADNSVDDAELLEVSGAEAAEAVLAGKTDAIFLVASARSPLVARLLAAHDVGLMSFERAEAYTRVHRYLSRVVLPRGVIDLGADIPRADIALLAPSATLVSTERLHPALVGLVLQAAVRIHGPGGLFEQAGQFPSPEHVDFPLSDDARRFYKYGPPFLQRFLPFWAATLIDRMLVMLLPLVALMLPLVKVMPPIYQWRMRARIYRWYRELLATDPQVASARDRAAALRELARIEAEVSKVHVPMSFADQLYQLRSHIHFVRAKMSDRESAGARPAISADE